MRHEIQFGLFNKHTIPGVCACVRATGQMTDIPELHQCGGSRRGCTLVAWNSALCLSNAKRSSDMNVMTPVSVSAGGPSRGSADVLWNRASSVPNMPARINGAVRAKIPPFQ